MSNPVPLDLQAKISTWRMKAAEGTLTLDEMKEILIVWNNTKGFINTIRVLGTVLKWVVSIAAAFGVVWYWIRK